jgi:hypothetical protein
MQDNRVIVFLGSTLPISEAKEILTADYRGPAARGDIYIATTERPKAILLIDGFFESVGSVFHKEILWALSQGVYVYGASSMGALRAAELASFGMVGIGKVYELYRDLEIERDDAVAVQQGPAELGYPCLTVALVDIAATLTEARRQEVIDDCSLRLLLRVAEDIFYKDRSYESLLEAGEVEGCSPCVIGRLRQWLLTGRISQKRLDAREALARVAADLEQGSSSFRADFRFQSTAAWQRLKAEMDRELQIPQCGRINGSLAEPPPLNEASPAVLEALAYVLASRDASSGEFEVREDDLAASAQSFRRESGLTTPEAVTSWLQQRSFTHKDYFRIISERYAVTAALEMYWPQVQETCRRLSQIRSGRIRP